jgi:hypothetical protein
MNMQFVHARTRAISMFLAVSIAVGFAAAVPATAAQFDLMLTTSRGCIEDGDNPVYAVGETITVTFRVGSSTVSSAATSLFDVLSDGRVGVISFGTIATNQTRQFTARIGRPTGLEKLILQADAFGVERTRKPCSFTVVSGTPAITRTPTPTRTPAPVGSMTPTASGALSAQVRTQRGCLETGDNATFAIGEQIRVSYRLSSDTIAFARATLADIQPNGLVKIFDFGNIPTNVTFLIVGGVGPPTGTKILQLRGKATGVPTAVANCSFRVTGTSPPTPTRAATRTKTATRTATPTKTPIPNTPCVGACTNPGTVTISDLAIVAQIAAGQLPLSACPSADPDHNGIVTLAELMQAVNNAINGC